MDELLLLALQAYEFSYAKTSSRKLCSGGMNMCQWCSWKSTQLQFKTQSECQADPIGVSSIGVQYPRQYRSRNHRVFHCF